MKARLSSELVLGCSPGRLSASTWDRLQAAPHAEGSKSAGAQGTSVDSTASTHSPTPPSVRRDHIPFRVPKQRGNGDILHYLLGTYNKKKI